VLEALLDRPGNANFKVSMSKKRKPGESGTLDFVSFARLRGLPKSARWLPREMLRSYRGVSASSFRDGAIRFCTCL